MGELHAHELTSLEDDSGAPFFNDTPTYLVSGTLGEVVGPYDPETIRRLEERPDLSVSGSVTLVRAMLADGLVDGVVSLPLPAGALVSLFTR